MRHFVWLSVVAVAIIAVEAGAFVSKSAPLSMESVSMNIMEMQQQAGHDLPVTIVNDPV